MYVKNGSINPLCIVSPKTNQTPQKQETYLFRAACSELRTEILNARKASMSKMATQRAHLQHEVDILSQKASQDSLALKDDLRGMLSDRKMAVRMQYQARDSKIQELNYKITVTLNSDSKSEVEGLRWVLTRRAAMAIAGMASKVSRVERATISVHTPITLLTGSISFAMPSPQSSRYDLCF